MFKIAAIIGGVLLMAGVALAGTVSGLGAANSPTLSSPLPAASTTARHDDRGREAEVRGRANVPGEDARGRANEAGEDLRGPCDEAEHANDPRCTVIAPTGTATTRADDHRGPNRGHDAGDDHGGNSGPGGGERGHGGHGSDD
jgi:hypothetical protein